MPGEERNDAASMVKGLALTVKNTFLDVVDEDPDIPMRCAQSMPFLCRAAAAEPSGGWLLNMSDIDDSDIHFEAGEEGSSLLHDDLHSSLQPSSVIETKSGTFRVKAVTFTLPSGDETALTVKNTFLEVEEQGEKDEDMRPFKSVPVSFAPTGAFAPLSPGAAARARRRAAASAATNALAGATVSEDDDEEAVTATPTVSLCHLRALSMNPNPQGPHLGLLWAPAGRGWGDDLRLTSAAAATTAAPAPAQPAQEPSQEAPATSVAPAAAPQPRPLQIAAALGVPSEGASTSYSGASAIRGRVWALSQDVQGCRDVQRAFEEAGPEEGRVLAEELRGHVWEALRSPHANHVLQKSIACLPPEALDFMVEELPASLATQAARHKYGCRIVQRLIEKCPPTQVRDLVDSLLADFGGLARHPYGNYVAQNLLEHAGDSARDRGYQQVVQDIRGLASDAFGGAVVSSALSRGPPEGQTAIARAILQEPGLLVFMACTRHGHVAAQRVLQVLQGADKEEAWQRLVAEKDSLSASRFGRLVAACL